MTDDMIFEKKDKWYFTDEYDYDHGPYTSEDECRLAFLEYQHQSKSAIRKRIDFEEAS